jgi:hypothetical protein
MKAVAATAETAQREIEEIASAIAHWYADQCSIRRLWAIEDPTALKILVALEPTADGGDTLPIWLANKRTWADDLRILAGREVQLELLVSDTLVEPYVNDDAIIAELSWRDSWMTP